MTELSEKNLFNRESSWLEFNSRVLAEAMDPSNLLFDRLKFMGIVSSNLDEFFMVRVASLEESGMPAGAIRQKASQQMDIQDQYFHEVMVSELEQAGITSLRSQALNEKQFEFVRNFFFRELFPVLTPIALFEDRPAPILNNLSLYIAFGLVALSTPHAKVQYAVVEVPKNFPRMISLPAQKGYHFILIEHLIALFARELFIGQEIISDGLLRITRAAEMRFDEETDEDFSKVMIEALRQRRQGWIVRAEISMGHEMREFLTQKLEITPDRICLVNSWFDLKSISQLAFQPLFQELKRPSWQPRTSPSFGEDDEIWSILKEKDIWLHHPYESFSHVLKFIAAAAADPDVLAIKQTLYRVSQDSPIVHLLEKAAEKGKQVTVLVELKARFDEEKNISWAHRLENAGATVIYGVRGLKTHAKACLVVRREPEGIKRYAHLSTGNYNEKTALLYTDIGYFTSREAMTHDLTVFFNTVTGFSQPMDLAKIDMAPYGLRRKLKRLIQREALRSTREHPGLIMAKMNSLVDGEVIDTLYQASKAGVKIKLHVRGICRLKPGVKNLSENIEVRSTVDMFLEHSRIFYFQNGGDEEVYLSSADWMPRNLDRRIEIIFPVEDPEIKKEISGLLGLYYKDNVKTWRLLPEGSYEKIESADEKKFRIQEFLCQRAAQREKRMEKTLPQELKPQRPRGKEKPAEN